MTATPTNMIEVAWSNELAQWVTIPQRDNLTEAELIAAEAA